MIRIRRTWISRLFISATALLIAKAGAAGFPEEGIRRILTSTISDSSATILWQTAKAEKDTVYAWTQDGKVVTQKDTAPTTDHKLTLKGLKPGSLYHYLVKGPSGSTYVQHFRTVERLGDKPDFVMAVVADPQFDDDRLGGSKHDAGSFRRVVKALNEQKVDFVVIPGDMVNNAGRKKVEDYRQNYEFFQGIATGLKMPYYVATGNHEYLDTQPGARQAYREVFKLEREYYSVDLFGRHFIFLDCVWSAGWKPGPDQVKWLIQDLDENREKDTFVILHYAVANDPYVFDGERGVMPEIQKILETHGRVRAVYNGHKNVMSVTVQGGILYVSTPQPAICPSGYLTVSVYPSGLIQNFHNTPGESRQYLIDPPRATRSEKVAPEEDLRWDCLYRWGEPDARNFTWRYGEQMTSSSKR